MTKILLVRHGHVEGIKPERFRGRADLPLTGRGMAEARMVAGRVASCWTPVKVYTSPLTRCVATGGEIAKPCKVPSEILDDLIDIDYGAWQGKLCEEAEAEDARLYRAWRTTPNLVRFPKGDSLQDLVARTADVLRLVLARHPADTVVLVGHDSVNRALLLQLLDQPLSCYWRLAQAPCCIKRGRRRRRVHSGAAHQRDASSRQDCRLMQVQRTRARLRPAAARAHPGFR